MPVTFRFTEMQTYFWSIDGRLVDGGLQVDKALGQRLNRGQGRQYVLLDDGLAHNDRFVVGNLLKISRCKFNMYKI